MSEFRLWVHRNLARLDGARERRFVALATALVLACAALGPDVVRVTAQTVNQPDILIDEIGPNPVPNPVIFKATTQNVMVGQFEFLVTMPSGSEIAMPGRRPSGTTDPARWESPPFQGEPGRTYTVAAKGMTSTGESVQSSRPVTFTIFAPTETATEPVPDASGGSGTGTAAGTAELFQLVAWPGTQPKIEAKGLTNGFIADSAIFRVEHVTGLAFLGEYFATQAAQNAWGAFIPLPGGQTYKVTFIASQAGVERVSTPREVSVPAPEVPPPAPAPTGTAPAPAPAPAVTMLLPHTGSEVTGPVTMAARVTNATATSLRFEVLDPAGVTRIVNAAAGPDGGWTAMFIGEPGQYGVSARTMLLDGSPLPPTDFRSFRILASATNTQTAPPPPPPPPTEPAPLPVTEPAAAPLIELFTPADGALPFPGTVPLSARVRNGVPDRVVAIVKNAAGAETVVLASKTETGDFWNAIFDGADGEYRFRMRATVAGTEVFSSERRFAVKRPAATTPPPPPPPTGTTTTTPPPLPPPPPPPTGTTAAPTGTTTPPPPPPTGTTAPETTTVLPPPPAAIPPELADECREAGIGPDRCAEWLKTRYQSRECLEAGAVTREACAELLARLNVATGETQLFGLVSREEILQARADAVALGGEPVRRDQLPASIQALLPLPRDPAALVRVVAVAAPKEDSSPALLILDADGDGLPDDVEPRFRTDPKNADTDGDGFDDGTEVKNGYNPAGEGALERPVRGVEKALLEGLPLEEPRGSDVVVDAGFTIEADASAPAEGDEEVIRLSGTAAPNSVVTIFIYSYLPVVVTTTTDENGNWTYDFGSKLAEGRHEAYVSVNDDTGKLVAASNPLAFFVREAQAVTEEDFLRPDVNVEEAPTTFSRWFIYGGIGLVALALILVIAIVRQVRKSPLPASDQGL